jgi:hypothetical protein
MYSILAGNMERAGNSLRDRRPPISRQLGQEARSLPMDSIPKVRPGAASPQ